MPLSNRAKLYDVWKLHALENIHTIQAVDSQGRWAVSQNSQVDNRVRRAISSRRFFRILFASCWSWPWNSVIAFVTSLDVSHCNLSLVLRSRPKWPRSQSWSNKSRLRLQQKQSMSVPETIKITCQFLSIGSIGPLAWLHHPKSDYISSPQLALVSPP